MDHEKVYGITANISFRQKRQTVGNFYEGIIIIIAVKRTTFTGFCQKQMLTMKNSKRCLKELEASPSKPNHSEWRDVNCEPKKETK